MGIFLALVCAFAYSLNYVFIQRGMRKSPKDNGSFISLLACVLTVLIIFIFLLLFGKGGSAEYSLFGLIYYGLAGIFTAFLGRTLLFAGIRKIGSSRAAALKNSAPVFTICFALLFLGETITLTAGMGIFIILFFLFLQARHDLLKVQPLDVNPSKEKWGFALAIISGMCFGFGQGFRKLGAIHYSDVILGSLIGSTIALMAFIIMEIVNKQFIRTWKRNLSDINPFFVAAGVVTGVAQVSFFAALLFTKVAYISTIAAIEPIITVILARFLLNKEESIDKQLIVTAFAVFAGTLFIIFEAG